MLALVHSATPLALLRRARLAFAAPVPALAVDVFRVLVGLLCLGYCLRLIGEVPLFWGADGLMDHRASRDAFWFTWQPLFQAEMTTAACRLILGGGCALALGIVFGVWPRCCAAGLYFIVVCGYRFNFLLLFVDDAIVHLLLFWLVLMPVGRTLTVGGLAGRAGWRDVVVGGAAVRLFLGNLVLLYAVAGLTKLRSPLWIEGHAVYATLKLHAGWFADSIGPQHLPLLRAANYGTLVLEPLFAVALCLPARRCRRLRRWLVVPFVAFHLGIIATFDAPFANLGCLAALPLWLRGEFPRAASPAMAPRLGGRERFAMVCLGLLIGASVTSVLHSGWRRPARESGAGEGAAPRLSAELGGAAQTTFFGALWLVGLAQQYRLLDWIDDRNFYGALHIRQERDGLPTLTLPSTALVPRGSRTTLLFTYLVGVTWMPVPQTALPALRRSLHLRLARRTCAALPGGGASRVTLEMTLQRIDPSHPRPAETFVLSQFRCAADKTLANVDSMYQVAGGE